MVHHTFFRTEGMRRLGGQRRRWQLRRFRVKDSEQPLFLDPICGAPAQPLEQVHADQQTVHNANILERGLYYDGQVTVREPRPAARFHGTPSADPTAAPSLGEHNAAVLAELGYGEEEVRALALGGAFGGRGSRSRM